VFLAFDIFIQSLALPQT